MIELEFVERLIRVVDESGIDSVEIERGGTRIKVNKTPPVAPSPPAQGAAQGSAPPATPAPAAAPGAAEPAGSDAGAEVPDEDDEAAEGSDLVEVTSPMVGTFYRSPAPDAPAYVEVGDRVSRGETLCIIEAMKLMNELECESPGTISEICVENAEPVEYGQVLFRVDPA